MPKVDCYICSVNYEVGEGSGMFCPLCYTKWKEDYDADKAKNLTMYVANNRIPGRGVQAIIVNGISVAEFSILMTQILGVYGARDQEIWDNEAHKIYKHSTCVIGFKSTYADVHYYFKDAVDSHNMHMPDSIYFSKAKEMTRARALEEIKDMAALEANETHASFGTEDANNMFDKYMALHSVINERS